MKYMGSKRRIAKHILPIMLKYRKEGQWWVEPFVGGGNMIENVTGLRLGADADRDVINALKLIRDNPEILPKNNKEFTELDYKAIRKNPDPNNPIHSFAAFAYAFGGKKWGVWSRDRVTNRDYVGEAYRNALKQSPKLQGVKLVVSSYQDLEIPKNSLIYCDPPYANTAKYSCDFNHNEFWEWCRAKVKEGHIVFISEYNAPADFVCIWQKELAATVNWKGKSKKGVEKLFIHKSQFDELF